jgi:hypothetical protein
MKCSAMAKSVEVNVLSAGQIAAVIPNDPIYE